MIDRHATIVWGVILALAAAPFARGDSPQLLSSDEGIQLAGSFGRKQPPPPPTPNRNNGGTTAPAPVSAAPPPPSSASMSSQSSAPRSAGSIPASFSSNAFPAWFWDPPKGQYAVGYSPVFRDSPTANDSAFTDAAWRLFKDQRSAVDGGVAITYTPYGSFHEGNSIDYHLSYSDSARFDSFVKSVVRLDSAIVPSLGAVKGMRIMLVGMSKINVDNRMIPPPPDVNVVAGSTDAIGVAESYFYESSSWIEAERNARIELALNSSTTSGLTTVERNGSRYAASSDIQTRTIDTTVNVVLTNVRVIKRRLDPMTNSRKVWVMGDVARR